VAVTRASVGAVAAAAAAAIALVLTLAPRSAAACGVSTADGVAACSLAEHEEATRPRWHVGASGIYPSTAIEFGGGLRTPETRAAALASVLYQPTPRVTLQAGMGATFGGGLETPTGRYNFSPGPTAEIGGSWRVVDGGRPFVILTSLLSFSAATTHLAGSDAGHAGYEAFDLRLGALAGVTLWKRLSLYALGRVFGGPVFWKYQGASVTGGDTHHYQVGAGVTWLVVRRFGLFAEGVPLGERALAAGLSVAF
jgi:hypothetical protein